jgi:2'-5' RNA ligase
MRCFLAVPVEPPALAEVQRLLRSLQGRLADVRWVRPDALHLTVHFFGEINDAQADAAIEAVADVVEQTSMFEVALDALGSFPPRGPARVLWLGVSREVPQLTRLALGCRDALAGAGFDVETREFRAHCTLGRPRGWSQAARAEWRALCASPTDVAAFSAARLVLYESVSGQGGSIYVERANLPFGPGGRSAARQP